MNNLCFLTNVSSSEWAAWGQTVGSILAVAAAILVGWNQNKTAMKLFKAEKRHARIELAKTLAALSRNCEKAIAFASEQLGDRNKIYDAAMGFVAFDLNNIKWIERSVAAIPLHNLPDTLITPTMCLHSTIRQFVEKTETALKDFKIIGSEQYNELFTTFGEMKISLAATSLDIEKEIRKIEADR
jgi:hypothetical protein